MRCDFDRLTFTANPFLEKNLEILSSSIDEYSSEQAKYQYFQRQVARQKLSQQSHLQRAKEENEARALQGKEPLPDEDLSKNSLFKPLSKPSRVENLLSSNKINLYCNQITSASTLAFNKMYIVDALNKKEKKPEK